MVRAIIRPEMTEKVVDSLENDGFVALTKMEVFGRGKQKGIQIGPTKYEELPKTMLMIVVDDGDVETVVETIKENSRTGSFGDGKIFLTKVEESYTIRTGERGV